MGRPIDEWQIRLPAGGGTFLAHAYTKGEARARVKRSLKLRRLPAGTTAEKVKRA